MDVAIHFEFPDRQKNLELLGIVQAQEATIKKDINLEFAAEPMGIKWAHAKFHLPFDASSPGPETAPQAAEAMKILIERTYPLIEPYIKKK